jgi:isocitrate dehydrogenase
MPQVELRFIFDLYAGVRPARLIPGVPSPIVGAQVHGIDFVLIRESTEGLFSSMGKGVTTHEDARETLVVTRKTTERLFDFSLHLAERRKKRGRPGRLTFVEKANVFKAFNWQRDIFAERKVNFPDVATDLLYVDACAAMMVRKPWNFDVMVMENMFGDILSDLAAGLIGGLGIAPSADIGDKHAVFQPCHGTAPDIMGQGKANPTAMILSVAMMLDWLADKRDHQPAADAADRARGRQGLCVGHQADGIWRQGRHRGGGARGDASLGLIRARRANRIPRPAQSFRDELVNCEGPRANQNENGEAGEIQEICFIARRSELRAGGRHRQKLDRTEAIRQVHSEYGDQDDNGHRNAGQHDEGAQDHR